MVRAAILLWLGLAALRPAAAVATPSTPEETVRRYLQSVKDGRLEEAYDLISRAMKGGKEKEVWVKEQKRLMQWADVKVFDFQVHPGKVQGDKAQVPNVLSSQDRFANQLGLTEHELYTLVKEDGAWKVDQQLIVEPPDIPKWFPKTEGEPGGASAPRSH
jgi:hypothetical protein